MEATTIPSERLCTLLSSTIGHMAYYGPELHVNYKKELSLAFGNYMEVYYGIDNRVRSHSIPVYSPVPV